MTAVINNEASTADEYHPDVWLESIAFGSCHSRGQLNEHMLKAKADGVKPSNIWDTIASKVDPQAFLWTGDAIYEPRGVKGDIPLDVMQNEYEQILHNKTIRYGKFIHSGLLEGGVHGTWDDHDYGGNDRGRELKGREERRDAFLEFLDVPRNDKRWDRKGVYSAIEFGEDNPDGEPDELTENNKVKVIFLDTRWHRERHCIPSVGSHPYIPFGAIVACVTRLLTAGLDLPTILPSWSGCSNDSEMLGKDQWMWLEQQLNESDASVHIVVSSIQVLTTNPVVEGWGHYPTERARLLKLLNNVPGLIVLSGDVHHAEVATTKQYTDDEVKTNTVANKGAIVEVTSSGLTHSCDEPFYGPLCKPILDAFPKHRFKGGNVKDPTAPSYFTSRNFGSIEIDWDERAFQVIVHNDAGDAVLATNFKMGEIAGMNPHELESVAKCTDGHLRPLFGKAITCLVLLICFIYRRRPSLETKKNTRKYKET